ncbi:MAG: hypothetical protein JSW54_00030 [Fidelibacterota bacterium]|nr:MAG: hypothetical protein JSW54_00030 [Candidatus Neomarinimicrobiota bacterium]
MRFILLLLVTILAMTCSDRERSNPLDPANPYTHGAPTSFRAVTNRDTVRLYWDSMLVKDLTGYRIYRSLGENPLMAYDTIAPWTTPYEEWNLNYNQHHTYAVQAVMSEGESFLSQPDTVIPGPHNFWIADFYSSQIWRISYDGAHVIGQEYFTSPAAIAVSPESDRVWIADYYERAVYIINTQFNEIERVTVDGLPIDLALVSSGDAFVLERLPDRISKISISGTTPDTLTVPDYIHASATLAYDDVTNTLWLSNPGSSTSGHIYRCWPYQSNSQWEPVASLDDPRRIRADPLSGGCWVAIDTGVVHINTSGTLTTYLPYLRIRDISLNPTNGDCYFVGYTGQEGRWQAGRLFGGQASDAEIILDNTITHLEDIQALSGEGRVGFMVSQIWTGQLIRIDSGGNLIGRLGGFDSYLELALE